MKVLAEHIQCQRFDEEEQCCYPDDYYKGCGGQAPPCFCTMLADDAFSNPDIYGWISIRYVAMQCKHFKAMEAPGLRCVDPEDHCETCRYWDDDWKDRGCKDFLSLNMNGRKMICDKFERKVVL